MTGIRRATLVAVALLCLGVGCTSYAAPEADVNPAVNMPGDLLGDPQRGAKIFLSQCVTCHGESGNGQGPRAALLEVKPRNFLSDAFREKFDRPRIFFTVALGKLSSEMPSWLKTLPVQDVADVSEYVFQRFVQKQIETASR